MVHKQGRDAEDPDAGLVQRQPPVQAVNELHQVGHAVGDDATHAPGQLVAGVGVEVDLVEAQVEGLAGLRILAGGDHRHGGALVAHEVERIDPGFRQPGLDPLGQFAGREPLPGRLHRIELGVDGPLKLRKEGQQAAGEPDDEQEARQEQADPAVQKETDATGHDRR
jgi:hypothetical protein